MKGWGGKKYDSIAINTTVVTGFTTSASAFVVMKHRYAVRNIRKCPYSSD
ncbi:MAG: hypothetical protein ACE1ZG_05380 [Gammaproteobacteria bacterium]